MEAIESVGFSEVEHLLAVVAAIISRVLEGSGGQPPAEQTQEAVKVGSRR